jgi:hypothetical protein
VLHTVAEIVIPIVLVLIAFGIFLALTGGSP